MDVAGIDDHPGAGGDARGLQQAGAPGRRQRRGQGLQVHPRLQQLNRQPFGKGLLQAGLDDGGAQGAGQQPVAFGAVFLQGLVPRLGCAQLRQMILVVLEVHDVGRAGALGGAGQGAARGLAGSPADQHGRGRLQGPVEPHHRLRIGHQVLEAEELEGGRAEGIGPLHRLAGAHRHGQPRPRQLPGESGDMAGAVAIEGPVGDEHHLGQDLRGAGAADLQDGAEGGHELGRPGGFDLGSGPSIRGHRATSRACCSGAGTEFVWSKGG